MAFMEKNLLPPYQPPYYFSRLLLCGRVFEAALRANFMASELSLLAIAQMMSAAWSLCLRIWSWSGMASAFSLNSVLFALALLASVLHLVPGSSFMISGFVYYTPTSGSPLFLPTSVFIIIIIYY